MLLQKESIEKIKENFKLNHYEIKIWTALLSKGISSASELADISGVPRSRCYDVLESLEKKGFTIMKIGKPIEYIAVKPDEILERIKKNIKQESDINLKLIETIKESEVFHELELLHKTGIEHVNPEELTDTFLGRNVINRQIKEMVKNVKDSIAISTTKNGFERKLNFLKKILPSKLNNGIKVKFIAPVEHKQIKEQGEFKIKSADNISNQLNHSVSNNLFFSSVEKKSLTKKTCIKQEEGGLIFTKPQRFHLRTFVGECKLRFVIADNRDVLIILTPENIDAKQERAVLVKSEFFSNTISELFGI